MAAFNSVEISDLVEHPIIKSLFPQQESHIDLIARKIMQEKYREDKPIIINKANVIIDGYVRTEACRRAGVEKIPVIIMDISDEKEMVEFTLAEQRERRNLTDGDILQCVKVFMEKNWYGVREPKKSDEHAYAPAADTIGCKVNKIQMAIKIVKEASEEQFQDVIHGRKTLHEVYTSLRRVKESKEDPGHIGTSALIAMASELLEKAAKMSITTKTIQKEDILKKLQTAIRKDEIQVMKADISKDVYKGSNKALERCNWYLVGTTY